MKVSTFRGVPFWAQVTLALLATAGTLVLEYLAREGEVDASSNQTNEDSKAKRRRSPRKNRSSRVVD